MKVILGDTKKVVLPDQTTVILCPMPECGRRFGGHLGDTALVSWRCAKCRMFHYGKIEQGLFVHWCTTNKPMKLAPPRKRLTTSIDSNRVAKLGGVLAGS